MRNMSNTQRLSHAVPSLVTIVGPTAGGKSALALELAKILNGEIICGDSQTIRRDMNIGTAKPSVEEQREIRHHLLDIIEPYDRYTAADFKVAADVAIEDIRSRGKLPILVGGTGLYIDSVLYDFQFMEAADPVRREELTNKTVSELRDMHHSSAIPLPFNSQNKRHLVRSLESGGLRALDKVIRSDAMVIGIEPPRDVLLERIEKRVDEMLRTGFIEEVRHIISKYGYPPLAWDAIGYKVVVQWLDSGNTTNTESIRQALMVATRQYAKRQKAWFKRNSHIHWFQDAASALAYAETIFQKL